MSTCKTTEFFSQQFLANLVRCERASHSVSFGQLERLVRRNAMMEVTQRLIGIGLVATICFASSDAQVIVQPGYNQPRYGQQSYTGAPMKYQNPAIYQQHRSLADEFQRNQVLQRMIENQILQMVHENQAQQLQQMPPGMVGLPLIHFPLRPRIGGGKLFSLTPSGVRGLHLGGYGLTRHPLLLREAGDPQEQENYEGRTQWARSVSGGPGRDFGVGSSQIHDVASDASVVGDSVNGVEDLPEPQALIAEDSTDKLVEPRHTGESDDAIVGSPLDRIHYDQPYNHDQHHPMNSPAMSSQFMKTANAVGQMIDTVASGLTDSKPSHENKDPMSSMTRHQDPSGNYQQQSQYQPSNRQGQRTESTNNWNAPNNEPMTGQSFNSQKPQNSEWSSMSPAQSSQNPSAKASGNDRHFQQPPASYPISNNPANNWLTSAKQIFTGQPSYQNPGYNNYQPGYQNYQNRPQNGGYRPNFNGPSPFNYGTSRPTSTATASASSSANNYNYYNPYQRSPYNNNPYVGYTPYGFSGAVDQFGRAILSQLPATVNSFIANPGNMDYLRNMMGQQLQRNYY